MAKDIFLKLNLQETNDLLYLLTMYGKVEKRHWEQQQKPKGHIYHSIKRLSKLFPMDKEVTISLAIEALEQQYEWELNSELYALQYLIKCEYEMKTILKCTGAIEVALHNCEAKELSQDNLKRITTSLTILKEQAKGLADLLRKEKYEL